MIDPKHLLPWRRVSIWPVGGLLQVGYAEDSDILLVLSTSGRGIFDCLTGQKIERDSNSDLDYFDPIKLLVHGFGMLENKSIRTGGLFGGGLTHTTNDDWFLEEEITPQGRGILLVSPNGKDKMSVYSESICELRAFGFSETGQSFIIATSCDLTIFVRNV